MNLDFGFKPSRSKIKEFGNVSASLDAGIGTNIQDIVAKDIQKKGGYKIVADQNRNIQFSELFRAGFDVHASRDRQGVVTKLEVSGVMNDVMANEVFDIIASNNEHIVVTYRDNLDEEAKKLVKKTKKPLWFVSMGKNGSVVLERQF